MHSRKDTAWWSEFAGQGVQEEDHDLALPPCEICSRRREASGPLVSGDAPTFDLDHVLCIECYFDMVEAAARSEVLDEFESYRAAVGRRYANYVLRWGIDEPAPKEPQLEDFLIHHLRARKLLTKAAAS